MKKNGFTLVELLAVMLVLSVIVVIAAPAVLNVNNSASKHISAQEKKNITEAAKFLAIDLDDYTSDVYNCKTGSWLHTQTTDSGEKAICNFSSSKWTSVVIPVEILISKNYLNSMKKTCSGNVTIIKSNNDYSVTLDNVECK